MTMKEHLLNVQGLEGNEVKDTVEAVKPDYAEAKREYKRNKEIIKDRFKEQEKETKKFLKDMNIEPVKEILDESLFEDIEYEEVDDTDFDDGIYYKNNRGPLADIIQQALTLGERVYKMGEKGVPTPTKIDGLHIENMGINYEGNKNYIKAYLENEEQEKGAIDIAKRYKRDFEIGEDKYVKGSGKYIKIYLKDEDFEGNYKEPGIKTKDTYTKRTNIRKAV